MNIFAILTNTITGCEHYRVMQPLQALRSLGHNTAYMTADAMLHEVAKGRKPWGPADIVVLNRTVVPRAMADALPRMFDGMRMDNPNIRIVVDFDDDLTQQHRVTQPEDFELPDLRIFDRITVTTSFLRDVMHRRAPGTPVTVIPNYVRVPDFMNRMRLTATDKITIGLSGSITHKEDWQALNQPLLRILTEYEDNVQLFVSGFQPDFSFPYITPVDLNMAGDVVLPFEEYPAVWAQCDIVLIPLDPNDRFNFSKSSVKALESAASARMVDSSHVGSCAIIAVSSPPIYLDFIKHSQTGLLVRQHSKEDWYQAIKQLIENVSLRKKLQINAFAEAMKWDLTVNAKRIAAVYENIIKSPSPYRSLVKRLR